MKKIIGLPIAIPGKMFKGLSRLFCRHFWLDDPIPWMYYTQSKFLIYRSEGMKPYVCQLCLKRKCLKIFRLAIMEESNVRI